MDVVIFLTVLQAYWHVMTVASNGNFRFRYTTPLFFRQSPSCQASKLFHPLGCSGSSLDWSLQKTITVDSTVLPKTHFVGSSSGYFSTCINLYLFTLDLLGFSVLSKSQKSFPLTHWCRIFNRKKFCLFGEVNHLWKNCLI